MRCPFCGNENSDEFVYCSSCGRAIKTDEVEPQRQASEPRCWVIFARIGFVLGIVSIALCWVPFLVGLSVGVNGIVFAALGFRTKDGYYRGKARVGLILSIIATAVSFAAYFIWVFAIFAAAGVV